jgi:hypothetical protein
MEKTGASTLTSPYIKVVLEGKPEGQLVLHPNHLPLEGVVRVHLHLPSNKRLAVFKSGKEKTRTRTRTRTLDAHDKYKYSFIICFTRNLMLLYLCTS